MRVFTAVQAAALGFLCACCVPLSSFGQSWDQAVVERTLGSQWQQMSRRAGMIFAGTVLATDAPSPENSNLVDRSEQGSIATLRVTLRVDHAISGVKTGEVLTIREWAGALSTQRRMRVGEHLLLFLYAPSRLGFTSPVGGAGGQIALDRGGRFADSNDHTAIQSLPTLHSAHGTPAVTVVPSFTRPSAISINQLERAIRSARGE